MILNITNNFSRSVNMDPEIGSPPCVTYLMIDFDSLFSDKAFLKLANFEFYEPKSTDFTSLECNIVLYNSAEWFSLYKIQS